MLRTSLYVCEAYMPISVMMWLFDVGTVIVCQ